MLTDPLLAHTRNALTKCIRGAGLYDAGQGLCRAADAGVIEVLVAEHGEAIAGAERGRLLQQLVADLLRHHQQRRVRLCTQIDTHTSVNECIWQLQLKRTRTDGKEVTSPYRHKHYNYQQRQTHASEYYM